jgi:foldase protein PrsA
MRNVKMLWGIIVCLLVCVLILLTLQIRSKETEPSADPGPARIIEQPEEQIVARIGDRAFTYEEFKDRLERTYGSEVLNQLLDREAVEQEAKSLGIWVDTSEIERDLERMQAGYESKEQFYRIMLEQLGLSEKDLREDSYYKLLAEKIAVRMIRVSDEEVERYIQSHPEEFRSYIQFRIFQIVVATREEAQAVLTELAKGVSFEALARQRSLDPTSAASGGDIGWVDSDDRFVAPEIIAVAKALNPGELSRPIALEQGYVIIRLEQTKEIHRRVDDEIRERIRKDLALTKAPPLRQVIEALRMKRNGVILDERFR